MTEYQELIRELKRNSEIMALVALLHGSLRCGNSNCPHYATVNVDSDAGGAIWCDTCASVGLPRLRRCEERWRQQYAEENNKNTVAFAPLDPTELPQAKYARRLLGLLRSEP